MEGTFDDPILASGYRLLGRYDELAEV